MPLALHIMPTVTAIASPTLVFNQPFGATPPASRASLVPSCQFSCADHSIASDKATSSGAIHIAGNRVSINPNFLSQSLPTLAVGKRFDPYAPLVEGQSLNLWQQLALSPIAFYQAMTRRNNTATGRFLKHTISDGCIAKKDPNSVQLSCSEYMAVAIKFYGQAGLFGTLQGVVAGLKRIGQCNPFNQSITDPIWQKTLTTEQAQQWRAQPKLETSTENAPLNLAA